jgi:hypothetical protein
VSKKQELKKRRRDGKRRKSYQEIFKYLLSDNQTAKLKPIIKIHCNSNTETFSTTDMITM